MLNFKKSIRRQLSALAVVCATISSAQALVVSGTWNSAGYDTVVFTVSAPATNVEMVYTSGYYDPTFSLFGSAGEHLITSNDGPGQNNFYSRLTQNLGVGVYSLVVSYCCQSVNYAWNQQGAQFVATDGFNAGNYWTGGAGTLSGMQSYLNGVNSFAAESYSLTISNVILVENNVPEPGSLALLGLGLTSLVAIRKPKRT